MNTNEECLLNFLSYSNPNFKAAESLMKFLYNHDRKIEFHNINPVFDIIDEMEFSNYNIIYE